MLQKAAVGSLLQPRVQFVCSPPGVAAQLSWSAGWAGSLHRAEGANLDLTGWRVAPVGPCQLCVLSADGKVKSNPCSCTNVPSPGWAPAEPLLLLRRSCSAVCATSAGGARLAQTQSCTLPSSTELLPALFSFFLSLHTCHFLISASLPSCAIPHCAFPQRTKWSLNIPWAALAVVLRGQ